VHPSYHDYGDFSRADPRAFDLGQPFNIIGALGCVCWIVAYVLIVRRAHRDRAYGLPIVAICFNFAWELLASFALPNPVWLWHTFDRVWLLVDVVIMAQLLRYGRALQTIPEFRAYFYPLVAVTFLAGLIGQYLFVIAYIDRLGLVVAFGINLVMSVAFCLWYFARRDDRRGVSVGAAWFKMLGTLGTSIECHWVVRMIDPELPSLGFLTFLCVAIFAVDVLYIVLVSRRDPYARAVGPSADPSALTAGAA